MIEFLMLTLVLGGDEPKPKIALTPEVQSIVDLARSTAPEVFADFDSQSLRNRTRGRLPHPLWRQRQTNIKALMAEHDIDGALVGGARLDPASNASIVNYQS